ncbi:hypothetical protein SAMN05421636_109198 [Pricia antarctica]|uniref:Lipoprotein n=1 Tax=Pricia antarctica TaxID=641691 RepID=A0A1G7HJF1_9FLAO|nr:hypothetical protein [Pricia antarctica]SDF00518.1 hypothetical protein SAMN05421636_109198 [Pricia antarctica]
MKKLILIITIAIAFSCSDSNPDKVGVIDKGENSHHVIFPDSLRSLVVKKRQDSSYWDTEMLKTDLSYKNERPTGPFMFGAFPVPNYDLIGKGTFSGLGNFGYSGAGKYYKTIKDKIILYNSFFVKKNNLNQKRLQNRKDEIFFQILVLTDTIDSVDFSHVGSEIISRNHPDYVGQGFYKTKNSTIDYVAFTTPENESYAIVSTRLFNLDFGKTILIAPQKNGSLRSMQIELPQLSSEEINRFTDKLLEEDRIVEFFTKPGNI